MKRFILLLATNGGLGNIPVAPGTWGTLAGIPIFYLMASFPPALYLLSWLALTAIAVWVCNEAGQIYGVVDDGRIVIDELVGYLVTVAFFPFSWTVALLGFGLFRLFDITKPPPASYFDNRMKNGFGVVMDDVVAGVYGWIVLFLLLRFF